jgi:shikimate dehydrogenase
MRAAVLGSPVAHSLSPVLHRAAYAHLGLRWRYDAIECDASQLPGFVASLTGEWAGLSLTMPLKTAALDLADELDGPAVAARSVNTLVLREGRLLGANTDVPGMVAALAWTDAADLAAGSSAGAPAERESAAVLGSGASARSAAVALASAGWRHLHVVARRPDATGDVVAAGESQGADVRVHPWADGAGLLTLPLVVSTVPRGAADALAGAVPAQPGVLFDIVYDPWPTPLAAAWRGAGGAVVGGLDLLVHQAAGQVRLMTGSEATETELVAVMRPAGAAALAARSR